MIRCLPVLCLAASVALAAAPSRKGPAGVLKLIDQLGDKETRKAAEKQLTDLGEEIVPALLKASKTHDDVDVRLRAAVLAAEIKRVEVRCFTGHTNGVVAFALSPDGGRMVSASGDRRGDFAPRVWDVATGKGLFQLKGHTAAVRSVTWSGDAKRILTGGFDGRLTLWDARAGKEIMTLRHGRKSEIIQVALSSDGKRAVSSCDDRTVHTWDLESERRLATNDDSRELTYGLALLPDGKHFATASYDGYVRLIETATGKLVRTSESRHGWHGGWAVAVSPDGKRIASCGGDQTAVLWDAQTGKKLKSFNGHGDSVHRVAFSRDGKRLITASYDRTARVWDITSGKEIQRLKGHTDHVYCAAFLPDGRYAVTSSQDRTLRLWRVRK